MRIVFLLSFPLIEISHASHLITDGMDSNIPLSTQNSDSLTLENPHLPVETGLVVLGLTFCIPQMPGPRWFRSAS